MGQYKSFFKNQRIRLQKQLNKKGVDKIYTLTHGGRQQLNYVNENKNDWAKD